MISRRDIRAVGIFLLIATMAALATYVLIDLAGPGPVALVATPTQPSSPTPTMPISETATVQPTASLTPSPVPFPQFGRITFGTGMDAGQVLGSGSTFPAGTQAVFATWSYQNMADGTSYQVSWSLDDSPWSYESLFWDADRHGSEGQAYTIQLSEYDADGLPPGNYRLELYIGERLSQLATFVVLGPTPTLPPPTTTPQPDMQALGQDALRALVELLVPQEVAEPTGEYMVVLAAPSLNLRDGPSLNANLLGDVPRGTAVECLGIPEWDGERFWYKVRALDSGQVGWASEVYLASWETATTPLLFTSNRAGSLDIYRIYPDGTGLTRLTSASGDEGDASWSPDRTHIVFTYARNNNSDLYYMQADGRSWVQLTSGPADDVHPVWSPDGSRIAFVSNQDGDWEICILDLVTWERRQLTFNQAWDSFPGWSPDGTWLVFTSRRTGNYDLFIINADTGEEIQLTTSPYSDAHPAWSPNGDEIVYTMVVAKGNSLLREIGILSLYNPTHPRRVTESADRQALHRYPDWSPDGQWIVFESERDGNEEVYIIPARGGIMANLTNAPRSGDTAPAWAR